MKPSSALPSMEEMSKVIEEHKALLAMLPDASNFEMGNVLLKGTSRKELDDIVVRHALARILRSIK